MQHAMHQVRKDKERSERKKGIYHSEARCGCTAFKECLNKQIQLSALFAVAISFTFFSSLYFKMEKHTTTFKLK